MSHATLLVAIPKTKQIDEAISEQMAPFDENGECFADGSRWDWYTVGGRFSGILNNENMIQVKDLDPKAFEKKRLEEARAGWREFQKADAQMREFLWGCDPN